MSGPGELSVKKILFVDNEMSVRTLFKMALDEAGLEVDVVMEDRPEKLMDDLEKLSTDPPDVIFLDINMPKKDGKECLKDIRSNNRFRQTPVFMYTGSDDKKDIEESFDGGANLYIVKPFSLEKEKDLLVKVFHLAKSDYLPQAPREKFVLTIEA